MKRAKLVFVIALVLVAAGCTLTERQMAMLGEPTADISVMPGLFCLGETVTVEWDGGPQLTGCPDSGEFEKCKYAGGGSSPAPGPWFLGSHILDFNMMGSDTAVLPSLTPYTFSYYVQWDGWAETHPEIVVDSGSRRVYGEVRDSAVAEPLATGGIYYPAVGLECGPNGRWVVAGNDDETGLDRNPDGLRGVGDGEEPPIPVADSADGHLSACAGVTTFCVTEIWADKEWRLSVEGGPTVILGGEGNPICTDEFAGYHPDDIKYEQANGEPILTMTDNGIAISTQSCSPGDPPPPWGFTFFEMEVEPGTLCAMSPTDGNPFSTIDSPGGFNVGTLQLRGVSLDRCMAALDPDHLEFVTNFVTMPTEINASIEAPTCNLEETCGDGVCEAVCEATECPEDCGDPAALTASSPGICGDGVVSGDEQCEINEDCGGGFFCGLQGSSTACTCVELILPGDQPPQQPGEPIVPSGETCEEFPVYDCVKTEFGYSYYTGRRCYDADGNVTFDGQVGGPFTSAVWLPFCPGGGGGADGGGGGGGGGGTCGDGICQASESACGVCSADCGPC